MKYMYLSITFLVFQELCWKLGCKYILGLSTYLCSQNYLPEWASMLNFDWLKFLKTNIIDKSET